MVDSNGALTPYAQMGGQAEWHARLADGQQFGPLSDEQMRGWAAQGNLPPDALVWRTGWPDWQPSAAVMHQIMPAAPPPPPAMFGAVSDEGYQDDDAVPDMSSAPRSSVPRRRRGGSDAQVWVIVLVVGLFLLIPILFWALANQPGG